MSQFINVFTDGGSRGNPGEAAIGVYITDSSSKEVAGFGKKIGITTNNVAEYKAVLEALDWIISDKEKLKNITKINFFLDSLLICSQITGVFKAKDAKLRALLVLVMEKQAKITPPIFYKHIPREQNKKADSYVNLALDTDPQFA